MFFKSLLRQTAVNHTIIYDTFFESLFKYNKNQDIEAESTFWRSQAFDAMTASFSEESVWCKFK